MSSSQFVCGDLIDGRVLGQYDSKAGLDALDPGEFLGGYMYPLHGSRDPSQVNAIEHLRHLEGLIGKSTRAYLDFWWNQEVLWGQAIQSQKGEGDARNLMCCDFHFLFDRRLDGHNSWPEAGWVDGFYPERIDVLGPDALEMPGTLLWVEGQERWWLEPAFVSIKLSAGACKAIAYTLMLGDATKGLETLPYHRRRAFVWTPPPQWLFVFQGPSSTLDAGTVGEEQ